MARIYKAVLYEDKYGRRFKANTLSKFGTKLYRYVRGDKRVKRVIYRGEDITTKINGLGIKIIDVKPAAKYADFEVPSFTHYAVENLK